jgi:hypothetical protein
MKRFIILCALVFVGAFGWQLGEKLSADALSMGIGIFFGVLASIPAALLVLAASRRGDRTSEQERRPQAYGQGHGYQSPVIVVAPPMQGYPQMQPPQGMQQPGMAGYLPSPHQVIDARNERSFRMVGEDDDWLEE